MADANSIIAKAQAYADSLQQRAEAFVATLQNVAQPTDPLVIASGPGLSIQAAPFVDSISAILGQLNGQTLNAPSIVTPSAVAPTAPTNADLGLTSIATTDLTNLVIPDFTAVAPTLNLPATPSLNLPSAPGSPPTFTAPTTPDAPAYALPAVPSLTSIALPDVPTVTLPTFASARPDLSLAPISNPFVFSETEYTDTLIDNTKAKLLNDILNGGYGIETADEARLWDRARDRENSSALLAVENARRQFSGRGFSLPPGALVSLTESAIQNSQDASNALSREIALKRGDLYVQNRQFAIQQSISIMDMIQRYHGAVMGRALEAAKALADTGIAYYNAQVARLNLQLDGYKTDAQVFETQVRAAVETVNVYRAQLEAARVQGEIDKNKIDIFRSQVAGVEALIGIYKTTVEAARVKADIEKLKLQAYQESVAAYVSTVQAKSVELNAYESAIKGEVAKQGLYESQVRAYTATVEATKAKVDVARAKLTAQVDAAKVKIAAFDAQIQGFKASLEGAVDVEKLKALGFENQVKAYTSKANAAVEAGRLVSTVQKNQFDEYVAGLNVQIESFKYYLERFKTLTQFKLGAAEYGSNFYSALVSGALSGINGVASQINTTTS